MPAHIHRVILFVADIPKTAEFYTRAFGLVPVHDEVTSEIWLELDASGFRLALHQAFGPDGPCQTPTGAPDNPHKIVFLAEDVAAKRDALIALGVEMDDIHVFGEMQYCDGTDPEGHRFQIANR